MSGISPPPDNISKEDQIVSAFHMRVKCERCDNYTTMKLRKIAGTMLCAECVVRDFSTIQIKEKKIKKNQIAPFHSFEHNQDSKDGQDK
jgi:late competence protein required for DNA uptake (superfamily II DNA/RNA helicase)